MPNEMQQLHYDYPLRVSAQRLCCIGSYFKEPVENGISTYEKLAQEDFDEEPDGEEKEDFDTEYD